MIEGQPFADKGYVSDLARLVFGARSLSEKIWVVLKIAFDASGTANDDRLLAVGGLVASIDQWERLETSWKTILVEAGFPVDAGGVPRPFRMSKFESRQGVFANDSAWDNRKRSQLIQRLIGTIRLRIRTRVYGVVLLDEYRKVFPGDKKNKWPYTLALIACADAVHQWSAQYAPSEQIAYLVEKGDKGQGLGLANFDELEKIGRARKYHIGPITLDGKDNLCLQAADIHAYEVRKYFEACLDNRGSRPPRLRRSFRELLKIPDSAGHILGGNKLLQYMDEKMGRENAKPMTLDPLSESDLSFLV